MAYIILRLQLPLITVFLFCAMLGLFNVLYQNENKHFLQFHLLTGQTLACFNPAYCNESTVLKGTVKPPIFMGFNDKHIQFKIGNCKLHYKWRILVLKKKNIYMFIYVHIYIQNQNFFHTYVYISMYLCVYK